MTVEYRNGVQSSTISYSNMIIPEGITKNEVFGKKFAVEGFCLINE